MYSIQMQFNFNSMYLDDTAIYIRKNYDVMIWKRILHYLLFVMGIHRSPVPNKGQ